MSNNSIEIGSTNIFKDLGHKNPAEHMAKVELTRQINNIILKLDLSQTALANLMGIPQPKISLLSRGIVSGFSLGKLITLLNRLHQDVDIVIRQQQPKPKRPKYGPGKISVIYAKTTKNIKKKQC